MFYLFIGVGAFLGAIARYFLSTFFIKAVFLGFPLGTFFVNVLGCYLIGVLSAIHISNKEFATPFLVIGFLGSFTTFSAFTKEILFFSNSNGMLTAFFTAFIISFACIFSTIIGFKMFS